VAGLGCATGPLPDEEFAIDRTAAEESAPLGGESLVQRKAEMQRSLRDLMHFHRTLSSLADRRDRASGRTSTPCSRGSGKVAIRK